MKIFFGGDVSPCEREWNFSPPRDADLVMVNLEAPMVSGIDPKQELKSGPHLSIRHTAECMRGWVLSLANNHMMDFGSAGLENTLSIARDHSCSVVGAGPDRESARAARRITVADGKVTLVSCCEEQFGSATPRRAGIATFGPWVYDTVRRAKAEGGKVVVSVHAGVEESPWPAPWRRDLFRSLIRAGADVIFGHHAHVPQGWESFEGGGIIYGAGNFLVDPERWNSDPLNRLSSCFLVELGSDCVLIDQRFYQSELQEGLVEAREVGKEREKWISDYQSDILAPLRKDGELEKLWQEICLCLYDYRNARMAGIPEGRDQGRGGIIPLLRGVHDRMEAAREKRLRSSVRSKLSQTQLLRTFLMTACESHRQALTTALGLLSGEIEDLRDARSREILRRWVPISRK